MNNMKGGMWLWSFELEEFGFRRRSRGYWQCRHRHGLVGDDYISAFLTTEEKHDENLSAIELTEFHVTFPRAGHRLHVYFHELREGEWECGGHTSAAEQDRMGQCAIQLRQTAREIAAQLLSQANARLVDDEYE